MTRKITLDDLEKLPSEHQVKAFRILNKARPDQIDENLKLALQFSGFMKAELLEIFEGRHIEIALTETTYWGNEKDRVLEAAKLLKDTQNVHLVHKFRSLASIEALKFLGVDNAECATHFFDEERLALLKENHDFDCSTVNAEPVAPTGEQSDTEGDSL